MYRHIRGPTELPALALTCGGLAVPGLGLWPSMGPVAVGGDTRKARRKYWDTTRLQVPNSTLPVMLPQQCALAQFRLLHAWCQPTSLRPRKPGGAFQSAPPDFFPLTFLT